MPFFFIFALGRLRLQKPSHFFFLHSEDQNYKNQALKYETSYNNHTLNLDPASLMRS
jgi:hypothetical protein